MDEEYKSKLAFNEAFALAARYCSLAERCPSDVCKKLDKYQVDADLMDQVIDELKKEKYIDTRRYIQAFVNDKFKFNGWGKVKIRYHLRTKELADSEIEYGLQNHIDEVDYTMKLAEILQNKNKTIKVDDAYGRKAKLIQFAQSRGFEFYIASDVVDKIVK